MSNVLTLVGAIVVLAQQKCAPKDTDIPSLQDTVEGHNTSPSDKHASSNSMLELKVPFTTLLPWHSPNGAVLKCISADAAALRQRVADMTRGNRLKASNKEHTGRC